ncbi:hypothetical protein NHQ30_005482 [Ciborinia camelliae]|nr:hypothetical protein NHQ30_005482 [Ciborinia camelliae]
MEEENILCEGWLNCLSWARTQIRLICCSSILTYNLGSRLGYGSLPIHTQSFSKPFKEALYNRRFKTILRGSPEVQETKWIVFVYMADTLNYDKYLLEVLMPSFSVRFRHVTPGIGYLNVLT